MKFTDYRLGDRGVMYWGQGVVQLIYSGLAPA
jgi:hypothetical protein